MNIQFYEQFYTGPASPGSLQPRRLMRLLAERGHRVAVVATDFNVYTEKDEPAEELATTAGGTLRVHRLPSPRGLRASLGARLKTYVGFAWKAWRYGVKLEVPDVVMGSIQPLFTGMAAQRVASQHRVPFLLEVRDLWPDALEAKGAVTGWKAQILHRLANRLYARPDWYVSLTPGIKVELVKKGLPAHKIDVFPNGFDPELFEVARGETERVRKDYGWDGQFVALYTGTHVEVTAIEVIVKAAAELRGRTDIRFDLFGQGQTKPAAMRLAGELGLKNIHFHDPVPKSQVPAIIAASDVTLMTLFRSRLIHIYFENKFMDYMGSGKPILAAMEGQQADIIRQYRTGRVVETFDHVGLAGLVAEAADHYEPYREMGLNGHRLVREHLLLPGILDRYADRVEAVAHGQSAEARAWEPLP